MYRAVIVFKHLPLWEKWQKIEAKSPKKSRGCYSMDVPRFYKKC